MDEKIYELTNPQKAIWLTEQFYKDTCINNICGALIIHDNVDLNKLKQTINIFVKENDSFRINLHFDSSNKIVQYFSDFSNFDVEICPISDNDDLLNLEKKLVNTPFNLFDSPLYRFKIFSLPNGHGGIICVFHHLIGDACTSSLLSSKLVNIYDELLKNEKEYISNITGTTKASFTTQSYSNTSIEDKNPSIQSYINYIESEKNYLASDKYIKDKEYWNNIFKTIPEVGLIPSLKQDNDDNCTALRKTFTLDSNYVNKINSFCSENKISLFNFFMAIYAIYIGKINSFDDFVLGTPILNRTTFAEKNTAGMFISTVPFYFHIDNSIPFINFAKQIAVDTIGMLRHQKYPYSDLLSDIRSANPNQPNLYDVLISYQNTKVDKNTSKIPYDISWFFNGYVADSLQIHLFDMNDEGKLTIAYDYRLSKYCEEDINALHNRICSMINHVLDNKYCLIKNIEIVTSNERELLLDTFNNTYLYFDKTKTVVDYFEEQVNKTPNAIALVYQNKSLTYKQLNEKVNSLARVLKQKQVSTNSIVGVMLNRSLEMMVSILAVLKAGAAYIPIDPDYPEERISYMLSQSESPVLISQKHLEDKIDKIKFEGIIIYSDFENTLIYALDNSNLNTIINPSHLSYIIYTSGSTGKPKGVMLTHKNLSNFISSMINKIDYLKDNQQHSIVSITTVSFDIFAFETIVSLCRGLKLFITNESEQKITIKLERLIQDNKIQIIQSTPSIMNFHLENSSMNGFTNLKYVILAGEQLPKSLVNKIKTISPNCTIYNGYGPSETTIFSTVQDVTNLESITIGEPINNTQIYILNKDLSLLPPNTIGEIYIAGYGVGNGYLYRDDLTKERYLDNPFDYEGVNLLDPNHVQYNLPESNKNPIMYKTGDLGLWLDDGTIECKGRADHQVKLRGLRIELEEIEECINSFNLYSNIKSAVIIKEENGKSYLNAFISSNVDLDLIDLKNYLSSKLPVYMIPNTYTILDSLPFTPNGKIDRKALSYYKVDTELKDETYTPPRNELEEILVKCIGKKLGLENFGIDNNIFDYGADSLCIINILTELFQYNINLKVVDFYKHPTIRDLHDNRLKNNDVQKKIEEGKLAQLDDFVKTFSTSSEATVDSSKKSVFITGATGFLGIHILADLLNQKDRIKKIYCSIRNKDAMQIEQRLIGQLHFYFGSKYDELVKEYVICINSNINETNLGIDVEILKAMENNIDCVIHAAANVKHYGNYSDFEKTNIQGTKHIIELCKTIHAPLHYISTMTISGNYLVEQSKKNIIFDENTFYKNQAFDDNVYSKSKLIAESCVLSAIQDGLDATIYRIGDLTGRYSDGVFQKNIQDNSIYLRLKSILDIGLVPDIILNNPLEFTPVEYAAKAISTILWSNENKNRIYHIYNPNMLTVNKLIDFLTEMNIDMKITSMENFSSTIEQFSKTLDNQNKIIGIINDFTKDNDLIYNHIITTTNDITCKYLSNLGFIWPTLDLAYIQRLLQYMINVSFIQKKGA